MSVASRLIEGLKGLDERAAPRLARHAGPQRELHGPARDVLLTRLWGLGNLALIAPSLARFEGRLRILTLRRNAAFLAAQLPRAEILGLPEPHDPRLLTSFWRRLRELRRDPPERVVDLEAFLHLPLAFVRSATGAPCVGLDTPGQRRAALLDRRVAWEPTAHVADRFAAVLQAAGLPTLAGPGPLHVPPDSARRAHELWLRDDAAHVLIHPGSGDHFAGRRWPPERFAALARRLADEGVEVLLSGSARERRLVQRIARASHGSARSLAGSLAPELFLGLIASADLVVTNDTAPLHIADALGVPTVGLYGPNTPHRYGPRRPGSRALFADLVCSPCLDDRGRKRSNCRHFACMTALPVDAAHAAARAALATPSASRRARAELVHAQR